MAPTADSVRDPHTLIANVGLTRLALGQTHARALR